MSKNRKQKRALTFVGYIVTAQEHNRILSLIEMTTGPLGVHKTDFKTEVQFWTAVEKVTGVSRGEGECFHAAIDRFFHLLKKNGVEWRKEKIGAIDRKSFYEATGIVMSETLTYEQIQANANRYLSKKVKPPRRFKHPKWTPPKAEKTAPTFETKDEFYKSWEWRTLRMEAIQAHGRACQCCGAAPGQKDASGAPVRICVDHIKPISKHWNLRLDLSNLQILCDECNMGKGNWSETDFRPVATVDDPFEGLDPAIVEQLTDRTTGRLQ
jgi:5-methylcytosine-specific restriction endonuclease McrA